MMFYIVFYDVKSIDSRMKVPCRTTFFHDRLEGIAKTQKITPQ
jgi:hypothetical protein